MSKNIIPYQLKKAIQSTNLYSEVDARRLAGSSKRLDICAAQFALLLHSLGGFKLQGKVCLEVGSGWVLSHSLICYLLGAKKVIATDVKRNARVKCLKTAVNKSVLSAVRDILSPFEQHELIRERLEKVISLERFDMKTLESLNIVYKAPVDIGKEKFTEDVDFIFSYSVLEHVDSREVGSLLTSLQRKLKRGGTQAHCIHLEDHKDIKENPYAFLAIPSSSYSLEDELNRGNRIRSGQWEDIIDDIEASRPQVMYKWARNDKKLPEKIDASIRYKNIDDLCVTHMGIALKKT